MTPDAELTVRLICAERKVAEVGVASSRNGLPPALVRDRAPSEVAALMPKLFSICSRAQGAAAAAALDAAASHAAFGKPAAHSGVFKFAGLHRDCYRPFQL